MFRVFEIIAWAVILVLLLYLWADVREIAGIAKENKRELLRASLSVRAAESYPNFQEEAGRQAELEKAEQEAEEQEQKEAQGKRILNASEEQVLDEVLTEFLG